MQLSIFPESQHFESSEFAEIRSTCRRVLTKSGKVRTMKLTYKERRSHESCHGEIQRAYGGHLPGHPTSHARCDPGLGDTQVKP
jgi:hypothetical protein